MYWTQDVVCFSKTFPNLCGLKHGNTSVKTVSIAGCSFLELGRPVVGVKLSLELFGYFPSLKSWWLHNVFESQLVVAKSTYLLDLKVG